MNKKIVSILTLLIIILSTGLKHASFKWEIYEGTTTLLNSGNFANVSQGDTISLLTNKSINSTTRTFTLYIWIDGANYENPSTMAGKNFLFRLNASATDENPVPSLPYNASNYLTALSTVDSSIKTVNQEATTNTAAMTTYRYAGATVNNYVYYNCTNNNTPTAATCELWRIIGVFPTYTPSSSSFENRVKIIKATSLETVMEYDNTSPYSTLWSTSDLSAYLNSGTYMTTTLKANAKLLTETARYYAGTIEPYETILGAYALERTITWDGTVALLYASDYGYAANGTDCDTTPLNSYSVANVSGVNCTNTDWLLSSDDYWIMTARTNELEWMFAVSSSGILILYRTGFTNSVRPVLYLSSDVLITGGSGTSGDPYTINIGG